MASAGGEAVGEAVGAPVLTVTAETTGVDVVICPHTSQNKPVPEGKFVVMGGSEVRGMP